MQSYGSRYWQVQQAGSIPLIFRAQYGEPLHQHVRPSPLPLHHLNVSVHCLEHHSLTNGLDHSTDDKKQAHHDEVSLVSFRFYPEVFPSFDLMWFCRPLVQRYEMSPSVPHLTYLSPQQFPFWRHWLIWPGEELLEPKDPSPPKLTHSAVAFLAAVWPLTQCLA